jgi:hypothetical protein
VRRGERRARRSSRFPTRREAPGDRTARPFAGADHDGDTRRGSSTRHPLSLLVLVAQMTSPPIYQACSRVRRWVILPQIGMHPLTSRECAGKRQDPTRKIQDLLSLQWPERLLLATAALNSLWSQGLHVIQPGALLCWYRALFVLVQRPESSPWGERTELPSGRGHRSRASGAQEVALTWPRIVRG